MGERYGSEAITDTFRREPSHILVRVLGFVVLALALIARFALPQPGPPETWGRILCALPLFSLGMVISLAWFSLTILRYGGATSNVVSRKLLARLRRSAWRHRWPHSAVRRALEAWARAKGKPGEQRHEDPDLRPDYLRRILEGRPDPLRERVVRRWRNRQKRGIEHILGGLGSVAAYEAQKMRWASVESILAGVETLKRKVIADGPRAPAVWRAALHTWTLQVGEIHELRKRVDGGNRCDSVAPGRPQK